MSKNEMKLVFCPEAEGFIFLNKCMECKLYSDSIENIGINQNIIRKCFSKKWWEDLQMQIRQLTDELKDRMNNGKSIEEIEVITK